MIADRLLAAGIMSSSKCRFCRNIKESVHHFVNECDFLPEGLNRHYIPEFEAPAFLSLGLLKSSRLKLSANSG